MSYSKHSIEQIYESEQEYALSEDSSLAYKYLYFFDSEQVQIEKYHYELINFPMLKSEAQNQKIISQYPQQNQTFLVDDALSYSASKSDQSIFQVIEEKGESIFSQSNQRTSSELSSRGKQNPLKKIAPRSQRKPKSKKTEKRSFKQNQSQSFQSSSIKVCRSTSKLHRKGKHSQSMTQKFIYFCTQFHYSKNFNQFLRKKILDKTGSVERYNNFQAAQKIETLENIISEIQEYKMALHYKVEGSIFMASFSVEEQHHIRELFARVIQRTYRMRLELEKKYIELDEEEPEDRGRKFFDEKCEDKFRKIFEELLDEKPFAQVLGKGRFEALLQEAMVKMGKKEEF